LGCGTADAPLRLLKFGKVESEGEEAIAEVILGLLHYSSL
jgi:hypothetical protein